MPRLQLIEIHEQTWCPAIVRDGATRCLNQIANLGRQYIHVVPRLHQALEHTGARRVVDLGSGSGGPWLTLHRRLNRLADEPIEILLTDLYPPAHQDLPPWIAYHPTPVDLTRIPAELTGFRTLFTTFHHFPPAQAQAILQDAVTQRQGIAIFEQTQRTWQAILLMFALPWLAWLSTPLIRPLRVSQIILTYFLPVIPLVLWFDGIVSCLRSYSPAELENMTAGLDGPSYRWEIGRVASPLSPLGITYALGYPISLPAAASSSSPTSPRVASTK